MNISITARNFSLFEGTKVGIEDELKRVAKMLPSDVSFNVVLMKIERNGKITFKCDITVRDASYFVKGEAETGKLEWSIDAAVDGVKRRLRRVKTALIDKSRAVKTKEFDKMFQNVALEELQLKEDLDAIETEGFNSVDDIKRRKRFELNVMTEEEAILQLELLGHSFFAFKNESGENVILYKRSKGYGLITLE